MTSLCMVDELVSDNIIKLLFTTLWKIPLLSVAELVNKLVQWCAWLLSSA